MLRQSLDAVARISPRFRRRMMRTWYEFLVVLDRNKDITFMNYGYQPTDPSTPRLALDPADEPDRYSIQLYHKVAAAPGPQRMEYCLILR